MPNWGPITSTAGPGTATPTGFERLVYTTGIFPLGSVFHLSGQSHTTAVGGAPDAAFAIRLRAFAANGDQISETQVLASRLTTPDGSWTYNVPLGSVNVQVWWVGSLYQGQTMTNVSSGTQDTQGFCQFGTELTPGGQATIILTQSFVETALLEVGLPWLAAALTPIYGLVLDATALCGTGPPQLPPVNTNLFQASVDVLLDVFKAVTWNNFCQCKPGTPTPAPFPTPAPTKPTSWPDSPTFPCDPADLCASISQIKATLNAMSGQVASMSQLVTLLQRYELPFAYINGAVHSSLTAQGGFATSRLVGLRVEVTQRPAEGLVLRGNPPYLFDMGWLSIVDSNGMLEEKRLTRDDQVWTPVRMATALRFQWDLFDGVIIRVTELEAEP